MMSKNSGDEEHLLKEWEPHNNNEGSQKQASKAVLVLSILLNVFLVGSGIILWTAQRSSHDKHFIPHEIYSPASEAVEYHTVVYQGGLHGDRSKYQGSSQEVDGEWEKLYNDVGLSQITSDQASQLPNKTTPTFSGSPHYLVELDVFHQLHCLNLMRKLVYPDVYKMDLVPGTEVADDNIYHMEHCYEQLRQSLQCASDIGTIYWEWSEERARMFGNLRTTHTCRNFDKIRNWAEAHQMDGDLDMFKPVEGAPRRTDPVSPEFKGAKQASETGHTHMHIT